MKKATRGGSHNQVSTPDTENTTFTFRFPGSWVLSNECVSCGSWISGSAQRSDLKSRGDSCIGNAEKAHLINLCLRYHRIGRFE